MASLSSDQADALEPIDLSTTPDFHLSGILVRPALREVCVGDRIELLEPRVMQVLAALAAERGQVVSRERLIERCWAGRIIGEDAINTCIAKIRRIGEAHQAFTIQTVPRVGYRLSTTAAPRSEPQLRRRARPNRKMAIAASAALLAAVIIALATWRLSTPPPFSLAIIPFQAPAGAPPAAALARQIDEDLAGAMTARHVDVAPPGWKPSALILVRGTVEARGGEARVRVLLEDRRAKLVLWQGEFEGAGGFDSTLPDQVSTKLTSMATTARGLYESSHGKVSPRALKAYVIGMDNYRERRNLAELLTFMRTMRDIAPGIPLVHAAYAQSLIESGGDQPESVRQAWRKEARAEAERAMKGDRKLGLGYAAMSNAMESRDFSGRMAVLQRGLRYAALDGPLNCFVGMLLAEVGRPLEGLPYVRRGHSIDPDAAPRLYADADQLVAAGLVDEALELLGHARRVWPKNARTAGSMTALAVSSMPPREGAEALKGLQASFPDAVPAGLWLDFFDSLACRCHGEATAGRIEAAARSGQAPVGLSAAALTRLGRLDQAFAVAELVKPDRLHIDGYKLLFAPATAPMRRQARFMDLAAHLGLVQYWRSSGQWPEFCAEPGLTYDCKLEAMRLSSVAAGP
jgi:DNA-binding winged helix-turn-helix (wHTH) protein